MNKLLESYQERGVADCFIISQKNKPYQLFEMFVSLLCMLSSFNYAYLAAFRMHKELNETIMSIWILYELIFFLDIILQFLLEFTSETSSIPVRDLEKIAWNYIYNGFVTDFIAIIPLQIIQLKNNRQNLFFLIKLIRLEKGLRLFDVTDIMKQIKLVFGERILLMIETKTPLQKTRLKIIPKSKLCCSSHLVLKL